MDAAVGGRSGGGVQGAEGDRVQAPAMAVALPEDEAGLDWVVPLLSVPLNGIASAGAMDGEQLPLAAPLSEAWRAFLRCAFRAALSTAPLSVLTARNSASLICFACTWAS